MKKLDLRIDIGCCHEAINTCPNGECFKCIDCQLTLSDVTAMFKLSCIACYMYLVNVYGYKHDEKYHFRRILYICDECIYEYVTYCKFCVVYAGKTNTNAYQDVYGDYGDYNDCKYSHCNVCQKFVDCFDYYRQRTIILDMDMMKQRGIEYEYCDNCGYCSCYNHIVCPKNENGLLYDKDARKLCLNCVNRKGIISRNLFNVISADCDKDIPNDIVKIILMYIKFIVKCCNENCNNKSRKIEIDDYVHFKSNQSMSASHYENDIDLLEFYCYAVNDEYVTTDAIRAKCRLIYGEWTRIFCRSCRYKMKEQLHQYKRKYRYKGYKGGQRQDMMINQDCSDKCGCVECNGICFNHPSCVSCLKRLISQQEYIDCGCVLCMQCREKDIYIKKYGNCKKCYYKKRDKEQKQKLYNIIIQSPSLLMVERSTKLIVNAILHYSYPYIFDCSNCQNQIQIINKLGNGTKDIYGELFEYYCIEDKFVNQDNVNDLSFVDEQYGFIRIFCHKCCSSKNYRKCRYCDNYENKVERVCYNHEKHQCEECGDCRYDDQASEFITKCACSDKNLCNDCATSYKHFKCRLKKEIIEYREFGLNGKYTLNENKLLNWKQDYYYNILKQKKMDKKRKVCKSNKRYWKRKYDKFKNKKSIYKWNKQWLLSINGY